MPSTVSFQDDGTGTKAITGLPAKRMSITNAENSVFGVKRLIGRRYDDPEVQELAQTLPYAVAAAPNGDAWIETCGSLVSPPHVSALLLAELRAVAEDYFGGWDPGSDHYRSCALRQ